VGAKGAWIKFLGGGAPTGCPDECSLCAGECNGLPFHTRVNGAKAGLVGKGCVSELEQYQGNGICIARKSWKSRRELRGPATT
jgi:hypothetical protein